MSTSSMKWLLGGGAVSVTGFLLFRNDFGSPPPKTSQVFPSEEDRRNVFSKKALSWDGLMRWPEFAAGLGLWRRKAVREAFGDVLETGVGTGRNFHHYDVAKVSSLTGVDFARPMLEVALKKKSNLNKGIFLRLVSADCKALPFQDDHFDSAVDTFGLCSFEDPKRVLLEIRRVVKPGGKVLLLEHGDSSWRFFKDYLQKHLLRHVELFGCYHNRDIEAIVKESGLIIEYAKRKHFGSTYLLVCRVPEIN